MKRQLLISTVIPMLIAASLSTQAQNLLNKVKSKANQELNKLENGAAKNPSPSNKNKLSSNVTRTVVVTLGAEENFDYQESCVDLGLANNQISFIVNKPSGNTNQCFAYKNGVRTAVPCPAPNSNCQGALQCSYAKLRLLEEGSDEIKKYITDQTSAGKTPGVTDEQLKQMSAYMTKEQLEEVKKAMKQASTQTYSVVDSRTIHFNGKTYGPYKTILQFLLTPDQKHFYAVTNEGTGYKVITSASAATMNFVIPPLAFLAAPDNSEFAAYSLNQDGSYSIHSSNGKVYKVEEPGFFRGAWYSASGTHIVSYVKDNVTIDGKVVKTFEANSNYEPCDLFVSSDAKGIAVVKDNTISFPDGDYFQFPLKIALINTAGKVYFKWLALEDRQVVLYQKPF